MYIDRIAQQVVDNLMEAIDDRNINIIDVSGIIIASGEKTRIGTYHQGGYDAIIQGKTIEITTDNVNEFEGAKEGVNIPINIEGKIVGVVGVYGQPDEVRMLARLVKKSVELALKQYVISEQTKLATDLKNQLIRILMYEDIKSKEEEILCLAKITGIDLNIKRYIVVFEPDSNQLNKWQAYDNIRKMESILLKSIGENEFLTILGHDLVLFCNEFKKHQELFRNLTEDYSCRIGIGSCRSNIEGYREAFLEAKECLDIESSNIVDINELAIQSKYLLNNIDKETMERYIKPLYLLVIDENGDVPSWLIETIDKLLKFNMNVSNASKALFIHKNTLLYRIKKVENLTGLSLNDNLYHIILLQLLLMYINQSNKKQ